MACPYFYPQAPLEGKGKRPRLPLGDPYTGLCRVDPMRDWRPDEATLRESCNLGYACGRCPRFPKQAGPDAIRFSVTGDQNGVLRIFYVCEQNHSPLEHGTLEYSLGSAAFLKGHSNPLLQKQAQAYVDSYLRRKHQPEQLARNPHRR
jgi:hypothetical protein